jgi:exodeoxyribonuclease-3
MGNPRYDSEGRVLRADFGDLTVVCVYVPSGTTGDVRQEFKMEFLEAFLPWIEALRSERPNLIVCGDFNVAHEPIDLARPKDNEGNAGFTKSGRQGMTNFLNNGFIDSWRMLHPDEQKYTWWSFRMGARARNIGWRIDYFLVSKKLEKQIKKAEIYDEVMGSDHCPIELDLA